MNRHESGEGQPGSELNPDIIVISGDKTFMFEPQNARASELLQLCCGLSTEAVWEGERVRVHPSRRDAIMRILTMAGLRVV